MNDRRQPKYTNRIRLPSGFFVSDQANKKAALGGKKGELFKPGFATRRKLRLRQCLKVYAYNPSVIFFGAHTVKLLLGTRVVHQKSVFVESASLSGQVDLPPEVPQLMGAGRSQLLPLIEIEYKVAIYLDVVHAIPLASIESIALGFVGDRAAKLYE